MESLIHSEVEALCNELRKDIASTASEGAEGGINIRHRFNISVINALWTMITGDRVDLNNPDLLSLVKRMDRLASSSQMKKPIRFIT